MNIKQIPGDFLVEEVIELNLEKDKQEYSIFKLTKKEWDEFKLIEKIANYLHIDQKFIGYAGNKDKKAITIQYISIYKIPKEKIENLKINDVKFEFVGYSKKRINLGDLKGNKFRIILRDLEKQSKIPKEIQLENYFDEQRFGNEFNTHIIGKLIIQRKFKEACNILKLDVNNNDFIGTLRRQPRRLLKFYISAYQSYIWNKTLIEILKKNKVKTLNTPIGELYFSKFKIKSFKIQIVNFDTPKSKEIDKVLKEENISRMDFIIRELPELISDSSDREAIIEVNNIKSNWQDDDLNKNKFKLELEFFLPNGCYATMLIKKLNSIVED